MRGGGSVGIQALVRVGADTRVLTQGLADQRSKRTVTADDRFAIASITKSMVATAVLRQVQAGRIGLDDPVGRWLPGVLPVRTITVRHLLSHRSGLHELTDVELPPGGAFTDEAFVRAAASHPLDFTPGSKGAYSNAGYTALGLLLEKVTGQPLATVLKREIFDPAGMTQTTLGDRPTVLGYAFAVATDQVLVGFGRAAGGVVSTARDVDRFFHLLLAGELLRADLVTLMAKPTGTVPLGVGEYGLGLWLWPFSCGKAIGHSGQLQAGFVSKAFTLPSRNRSVVILVNESDGSGIANGVAGDVLCA